MASARQVLQSPVRSRIPSRDKSAPSLPPVEVSGLTLRSRTRKADIGGAVTGGELERTIEGASTLSLDVFDADGVLLNSPILVETDPVDVQLDRFWFRLVRVSKQGTTLTLTFEDREVSLMRLVTRPRRAFRGNVTRAEFVLSMVKETMGDDGRKVEIPYYMPELHERQPVGGRPVLADDPDPPKKDKAKPAVTRGLGPHENLKIKGQKASAYQLHNAEIALNEGTRLKASKLAMLAMLCAGIGESSFMAVANAQGSGYEGVFQASPRNIPRTDTQQQAHYFFVGGKGFQAGGAMNLSKTVADPGTIATRVEASGQPGSFYGVFLPEAKAILSAYGGAGGEATKGGGTADRTVVVTKRYAFTRGSVKKRESSWTAAQRLAEEVAWRAFMNEGVFYFVSEQALYGAKPKLTLSEASEGVTSIDFDADQNVAVSEATVACRAEMWVADPGTVVKLEDLGRASKNNWLVASMRRGVFDRDTTITLKQPMKEKPEPAPETTTKTIPGTKGRGSSAGAGKGGTSGKVIRDDSICRGVGLKPAVIEFLELAAGHLGKPIHVTTSTCHNRLSGSGLVSDHWEGNAADLGSVRNGFANGSSGGDALALACGKVGGTRAVIGTYTRFSWKSPSSGRNHSVQVLWKVEAHFDHVHVGVS